MPLESAHFAQRIVIYFDILQKVTNNIEYTVLYWTDPNENVKLEDFYTLVVFKKGWELCNGVFGNE